MPRLIDLTGRVFGRLTVLRRSGTDALNKPTWLCSCKCGEVVVIRGSDLRRGLTVSCGCGRAEVASAMGLRNTVHGHSPHRGGSPTYRTWAMMIQRVTNPKHRYWAYYGGRGITVCDQWRTFENFLADMGERPEGKTLDRIDNNGNYEPGNCRWATWIEQNQNHSRYRGEHASRH